MVSLLTQDDGDAPVADGVAEGDEAELGLDLNKTKKKKKKKVRAPFMPSSSAWGMAAMSDNATVLQGHEGRSRTYCDTQTK